MVLSKVQFLPCLSQDGPTRKVFNILGTVSTSVLLPSGICYTIVCPPIQGGNLQALVSGLSPVQGDKL